MGGQKTVGAWTAPVRATNCTAAEQKLHCSGEMLHCSGKCCTAAGKGCTAAEKCCTAVLLQHFQNAAQKLQQISPQTGVKAFFFVFDGQPMCEKNMLVHSVND
jgi:hypothetical protein